MIEYDLKLFNLMATQFALDAINKAQFLKYFIKETDLQAIAGKLQKRAERLDKEVEALDAMLRERDER